MQGHSSIKDKFCQEQQKRSGEEAVLFPFSPARREIEQNAFLDKFVQMFYAISISTRNRRI